MRLRIRSKILASFMAMVALIIALIVFALISTGIMTEGNRRLVYAQKKESLVSDLQVTIDQAVSALGEYLVSGRKSRRATFIQLVLFYKKRLDALDESRRRAAGTPMRGDREGKEIADLKADLEVIDSSSREILALADKIDKAEGRTLIQGVLGSLKSSLDKREGGGSATAPPGELELLGSVLGVSTRDAQKRLAELEVLSRTISESESRLRELSLQLIGAKDRTLRTIGELREIAQREAGVAADMAMLAEQQARKFMFVGAVMTLACGLVLALYLSRSFSRPILALDRGARLIGEGNFDYRMNIDTGDELADLAFRFNTMAGKLKAHYATLEEQVRRRTLELERSNLQLRRLFDGISDGISVIDREFRIVNANNGIAAIAGRGVAELIGTTCYRSYNGSDAPCPGCPAAETFAHGAASSNMLRWCPAKQKAREMQISIFPLLEEKGKVMHIIEYAKDISEKKALEHKLFQSAKLAGIGTLAAGVAHEIRNPLGIMKASADMIKKNSRPGEQAYELAGFMIEEVDRLNRVVTRLLNFARPSQPHNEPCDLTEIMDRALALVGPQHRLQDLEVVKQYAPAVPPVLGDREQLCQVFLNLIINAAQAMPSGGRLTVAAGAEDGEAVVGSVSDTGPGIDEKIIDNIFDPFFSTKEDGSGLGLAIAHRIVEAHKGRVEVKSTPGKGTTFAVLLPAA